MGWTPLARHLPWAGAAPLAGCLPGCLGGHPRLCARNPTMARALGTWPSARTLSPADNAKAINAVRATLVQGIGGAVILLGAYFTYRQLQTGREQLQVALQGQVTERFTRAIDQLGHTVLDQSMTREYGACQPSGGGGHANSIGAIHSCWCPESRSGESRGRRGTHHRR